MRGDLFVFFVGLMIVGTSGPLFSGPILDDPAQPIRPVDPTRDQFGWSCPSERDRLRSLISTHAISCLGYDSTFCSLVRTYRDCYFLYPPGNPDDVIASISVLRAEGGREVCDAIYRTFQTAESLCLTLGEQIRQLYRQMLRLGCAIGSDIQIPTRDHTDESTCDL